MTIDFVSAIVTSRGTLPETQLFAGQFLCAALAASIVNYRCRLGERISEKRNEVYKRKKTKRKENDAGESPMGNIIFLTTAIGGRPILAMNFDGRPPRLYRS